MVAPVDRGKDYRTYSRFARDPQIFYYLVEKVLYGLARRRQEKDTLRLWSVGCAGGEEPYSLAIAWECCLAEEFPEVTVEIVGTDVDRRSLDRAKGAVYDGYAVSNLPVEWIAKSFDVLPENTYRLRDLITSKVRFEHCDIRDTNVRSFDLVLCRYSVFLYLSSVDRITILHHLIACLPSGYLIVGLTDQLPQGYESLGLRRIKAGGGVLGIYSTSKSSSTDLLDVGSLSEFQQRQRREEPPRKRRRDTTHTTKPAVSVVVVESVKKATVKQQPVVEKVPETTKKKKPILRPVASEPLLRRPVTKKTPRRLDPLDPPPPKTGKKMSASQMADLLKRIAAVKPPDDTPEEEEDDEPKKKLAAPDVDRLVDRLMADVVRREQEVQAWRADILRAYEAAPPKVTTVALEAFLNRMATDVDRRKRKLHRELEQPETVEEKHGLDGLRGIAAFQQSYSLAVRPTNLVRYMLRRGDHPPPSSRQQRPSRLLSLEQQQPAPDVSSADRLAYLDQASAPRKSRLRLGTATFEWAFRRR